MRPLDMRDRAQVQTLLAELQPAVIYLPAALANVDYCESHPEVGYAVNVVGLRHVVEMANEVGAKLTYFSTDYVFDGKAGPYDETDPANPICEYGRQKLIAEHYVATQAEKALILRTTVVYGWERQGKNFIYRLLKTLRAGQVLKVPEDQIGSPTYAPNLAHASVELATSDATGIFHVAGPELANRLEFAREAAQVFGLPSALIQGVSTSELAQGAPRPLNAGMFVHKAMARLSSPLIGYREGLKHMASTGANGS
jgi:dTDP-4-dehydrorhamnose reductase